MVLYLLTNRVLSGLLLSIVYYERFSSDDKFRTVINRILSHVCIISIARYLRNLSKDKHSRQTNGWHGCFLTERLRVQI